MSVVLSEHLPLLASAPDGIQELRGLILELAVRGKLVPQDQQDEPASELLKRIAKEKARLVSEGKIRKGQPLASVGEDEYPFMLPKGWGWVRLGQIGDWGAGATPLRSNSQFYGGAIPWFKSGELTADFISESEEHITAQALKECSLRQNQPGDVLIAMYGATIGKSAILSIAATTNQAVCACTPNTGVDNRYLLLLLRALKSNFVGQGAGGAQPNISREKIIATIAALPPAAEQHCIVAKVDELMALCDRLEAAQTDSTTAHARIVDTLLGTLAQSLDADELAANWQRLGRHFDNLFSTEASIDALKQTILQLAVMGKLVPQDPNDEPASEFLKQIVKERSLLEAEGTCKRSTSVPPIGVDEQPFGVPTEWKWIRLAELLAVVTDGDHLPPPKAEDGVPFLVIGNLNAGHISFDGCRFVPDAYFNALDWSKRPTTGDLLYTVTGSFGIPIPVKTNAPFCVQRHVAILKAVASSPSSYLLRYLQSPLAKSFAAAVATGIAQKTVTLGALRSMPIAVPPAAEQHRIVAKVDELMALCDRLKTDLTESRSWQARLSATLIKAALQAA